jgi:predicted nucleic acid-binding protein
VTAFVLDASAALSWYFDDEVTAAADRLLERLATETAAVPSLWFLEIANAMVIAERRGRVSPARSAEFIAQLEMLPIRSEQDSPVAFTKILELARAQRLSTYDAAYLDLAMRLGVSLASKDAALCDAAERVGVTVLRAA